MNLLFEPWIYHRQFKTALFFISTLIIAVASVSAASEPLSVQVLDSQGKPFPGAVVELQHPDAIRSNELPQASMDQINKQFAPYLLVVEQSTPVIFANSDSIKHHVFSFSAAKRFQLRLYKGQPQEPLIFDKAGVVALGCNIHDWMVGYIYVAQSKLYLQSDEQGYAHFDVPDRNYTLKVWHPRFKQADSARTTSLSPSGQTEVFTLKQTLHPMLDDQADEFDSY